MFYIFCSFTLLVCGEKNILPNLTNSQDLEPFFWPLGAGADRKKTQEPEPEPEPEPIGNEIRSRLKKK